MDIYESSIKAAEKHRMVLRPCLAGKTWNAACWRDGVLYETRQHPSIVKAIVTLVAKLEGKSANADSSDDDDDS